MSVLSEFRCVLSSSVQLICGDLLRSEGKQLPCMRTPGTGFLVAVSAQYVGFELSPPFLPCTLLSHLAREVGQDGI